MEVMKEIDNIMTQLDKLIKKAYLDGKIPQYGTSGYNLIAESMLILHTEIDPLVSKAN